MSHKVNLYLIKDRASNRITITGELQDDEWEILLKYNEYADELANIALVRNGGPGNLTLNYNKEKGYSYSCSLPPEEQIIALLHRLRPFLLNDEPTNFNKIRNCLCRRFKDDELEKLLKMQKDAFLGNHMQSMVKFISNKVVINSEEILQKWLNAHEYHKDLDRQKELESLHQIFPLETSRTIFIMMLYDKANAILEVSHIIAVLLGRQESFSFNV